MKSHAAPPQPRPQNRLVARLKSSEGRQLLARCDTVQLRPAEVLSEPGVPMRHVYFPIQGFICLVARIEGQRGVQVGMVGDEGMLGSQAVLGMAAAPWQALVQGEGASLRMDTSALRSALASSPTLVDILHRYLHVQMAQLAMSAACLRFHRLGPRLARWLLMAQDRAHADSFQVTQEFLACMLGVRRAGVSTAASALQRRGLIHDRRGMFTVLDRAGLQAMACSCYGADKQSYAEVLA